MSVLADPIAPTIRPTRDGSHVQTVPHGSFGRIKKKRGARQLIFMPGLFFKIGRNGVEMSNIERECNSFQKAAKFAAAEKTAIDTANPSDSTLPKSPYVGVQFAAIPEFQAIGVAVGQQMSAALAGKSTVTAALKAGQNAADREMRKAGYYR